ncbi:hypothetical protein KC19_VG288700 [Ceratodon purpureus]|uniref:Uncharacterized protein n=1 Tax=Ceratodon purpureus TaxID=3225 RepID=A0A8T0HVM9_CERPU|nr:hypothetical protein KC19_VG288700 [Ceratodon purpureus]
MLPPLLTRVAGRGGDSSRLGVEWASPTIGGVGSRTRSKSKSSDSGGLFQNPGLDGALTFTGGLGGFSGGTGLSSATTSRIRSTMLYASKTISFISILGSRSLCLREFEVALACAP